MEIGLHIPHHRPLATPELIHQAGQQIEARGFKTIWLSDHVLPPNVPEQAHRRIFYEPLAVASYLAAATTRVRIGLSVLVVPYRNPIVTAKQLATIDALSGGRLTIGVGVGGLKGEFEALGVPFAARGRQTDEYLRIMRELWTSDAPEFVGPTLRFQNVNFWPKPIQRPTPPILVGGSTPRAIRRAAELGDGWHPGTQSRTNLKANLERYRAECARVGQPANCPVVYRTDVRLTETSTGSRTPFTGTATEIAEDLRALAELGIDEVVLDFAVAPVETGADWLTVVDRFDQEVRPLLGLAKE